MNEQDLPNIRSPFFLRFLPEKRLGPYMPSAFSLDTLYSHRAAFIELQNRAREELLRFQRAIQPFLTRGNIAMRVAPAVMIPTLALVTVSDKTEERRQCEFRFRFDGKTERMFRGRLQHHIRSHDCMQKTLTWDESCTQLVFLLWLIACVSDSNCEEYWLLTDELARRGFRRQNLHSFRLSKQTQPRASADIEAA